MPYSMPLWSILVKCPAPIGPTCAQPRSGAGAKDFRTGSMVFATAGVAPTIRQ